MNVYNIGCIHYKADKNIVAIDIGMHVGWASLYFASMANVEKVYSYEPFEENLVDALSNFALNPSISYKISVNNFGLGNKNELQEVNKFKSCREDTRGYASIVIKDSAEVLEPVINDNYLQGIIWLKCNCEGGEYDVFESLDNAGLLSKIHIITMEYHGSDEKLSFLQTILFKNHFVFYQTDHIGTGMIFAFNTRAWS